MRRFNINILKRNRHALDFEYLLESHNLKLEIRHPTRLSSKSCIDNFAHNISRCKSEIIEFGMSDHTAQLLQCPVKKSCVIKSWRIRRRNYSTDNLSKFKNFINSLSFTDIYNTNDPNKAYNFFLDLFLCFTIYVFLSKL